MTLPLDDRPTPFRQVAEYSKGEQVSLKKPVPQWLKPILVSL
jgi:hypothetical protein